MTLHAEDHRGHLRDGVVERLARRFRHRGWVTVRDADARVEPPLRFDIRRMMSSGEAGSSISASAPCGASAAPRHPPGPPPSGVGLAPWRRPRRRVPAPGARSPARIRATERPLLRGRLDLVVPCTIRASIRRAPPDRGAAIRARPALPTHRQGAEASARGARIRARRSPHGPVALLPAWAAAERHGSCEGNERMRHRYEPRGGSHAQD